MKKLLLLVTLLISLFSFSVAANAENGAPIYEHQLDANTSYSIPQGKNIGMIKMIKPAYVEEYEIQYFQDYFVVLFVTADDSARRQSLQSEVGVRQEYGPNPRVNAVKEKLVQGNHFPKDLANIYPDPLVPTQAEAVPYIAGFIRNNYPELGRDWYMDFVREYRFEYQGALQTYVYKVMVPAGSTDKLWAEIHCDEEGGIYKNVDAASGGFHLVKLN